MKKLLLLLFIQLLLVNCSESNDPASTDTNGDTAQKLTDTLNQSDTLSSDTIQPPDNISTDTNTSNETTEHTDPSFDVMLIGKIEYDTFSNYSYTKLIVEYPDSAIVKSLGFLLNEIPSKGDTVIYPPVTNFSDTTLYYLPFDKYNFYTYQYKELHVEDKLFCSELSKSRFLGWYDLNDGSYIDDKAKKIDMTPIDSTTYYSFNGWLSKSDDSIQLHCSITDGNKLVTDSILPFYISNKSNFKFLENHELAIDSIEYRGYADVRMPKQDSLTAFQIWWITYNDTTYTFDGGVIKTTE